MVLRRWIISTNPINRTDCIHDCYAEVRPPSPTPSTSTSANHHLFANAFIAAICAAAVAFFLVLTNYTVLVRRRCAEHVASGDDLPSAAAVSEADYHVWRICTVGLDESTINSIPMKPYITGSGGGIADCSVCLGEFRDGELVRLLPACDHAFHAPCIDTWLRAHIRCPLCRAHVIVPNDFGSGGLASMHPYGNALSSDQWVSGDLEDDRGREIRIDTITDSSLDCSENPIIRPFCELPGNRLQLVWRSNSIDSLPVPDLFLSIDRDGNCLEEKEQEYYYSDEDSGNEKGKQGSSSKGDCQQICLA